MKKKAVAIALTVALLAIGVVGGTIAYFQDTKTSTNTFTMGKVEITLQETSDKIEGDNSVITGEAKQDGSGFSYSNVMPGSKYSKAPKVTVNKGSQPCWVFVTVSVDKKINHSNLLNGPASGWSVVKGEDPNNTNNILYCFKCNEKVNAESTVCPFTIVTMKSDIDQATFQGTGVDMTVKAYAIQAEGLTIDQAYTALSLPTFS